MTVVICAVATYIYEALLTDHPLTKRDIYYRDVGLFKRQKVVDDVYGLRPRHQRISDNSEAVDDLAATFGVERSALLVVCTASFVYSHWIWQASIEQRNLLWICPLHSARQRHSYTRE